MAKKSSGKTKHRIHESGGEALEAALAKTDDQWEIFKLAFMTAGRIAILSELTREEALYDYRFPEAVR